SNYSSPRGIPAPLVQELRAGDNRLDESLHPVAIGGKPGTHPLDHDLIRKHGASSKGVGEHFATEIVHEVLLTSPGKVGLQTFQAGAGAVVGEAHARLDGPTAKVDNPSFADGSIAFESQSERIE